MKNENLIRAIGALDGELIERAEQRDNHVPIETRTRRIFRKPAILVAAVAATILVGATACFAAGAFDSFFNHFSSGGDIDKFAGHIAATVTSAANDDLEIGISGAVMDRRQCLIAFSAKGVSDTGRDIVNREDFPLLDVLEVTATLTDGTVIQQDCTAEWHPGSRNSSDALSSYVLNVRPTDIEIGSIEMITVSFAGLSVELNVQDYIMETVPLYSDDTNALEVVEMSPIGIYAEIPAADTQDLSAYMEIVPIMADGSLAEEYSLSGTYSYDETTQTAYMYTSFAINEDKTLKTEIVDVGMYAGLQINGISYYVKNN